MKWWLDVPSLADGIYWGMLIHRHESAPDWISALNRVPPEHRSDAERYLREMAVRMRLARAAKRD